MPICICIRSYVMSVGGCVRAYVCVVYVCVLTRMCECERTMSVSWVRASVRVGLRHTSVCMRACV